MTGRLRRALKMSPLALARRLVRETQIAAEDAQRRSADVVSPTYSRHTAGLVGSLLAGIQPVERSSLDSRAVHLYCENRFDLLGSGWTSVRYGMECPGMGGIVFPPAVPEIRHADTALLSDLVNKANLREASRLWSLLPPEYEPIDWQLDFRSGYRWDARTWYRDIEFGKIRGADIKLPWELSRLQHLPQMALEYGNSGSPELRFAYRNQILDWLATNPPRYGANWYSTMDVAIRAANLLVSHDLFRAYGARFDDEFNSVFFRSIREHAIHILENLEWSETLRANHYLANIAGLIFCAAYLPQSDETDAWLAFGEAELKTAVTEQFGEDGSNFEASTCYHRLSAEMVVFASAVLSRTVRRLPPGGHETVAFMRERTAAMARFAALVTKPNGNVWQVGDNDSGRFFKLAPAWIGNDVGGPGENHLDHSHIQLAVASLSGNETAGDADSAVVAALTGEGENHFSPGESSAAADGDFADGHFDAIPQPASRRTRTIEVPQSLLKDVRARASIPFGLFIYSGSQFFLGIRCGPVGQNGIGGHAHADQLSIELQVAGEDVISDPGTYVYTPLPEMRNLYRSTSAHSSPQAIGLDQASLEEGLFRLADPCEARCLSFSSDRFVGEIRRGARVVRREVTISGGKVEITDMAWGCELGPEEPVEVAFSPGYGIQEGAHTK